ncbi:MAG: class I SAM-dependent methyltransferase [Kaistella sp.]|nr:class I SAM-dependent methyltransferase [Kaistella sp.]
MYFRYISKSQLACIWSQIKRHIKIIDLGYEDFTIIDISAKAIDRAKERLGDKAKNVKWIV